MLFKALCTLPCALLLFQSDAQCIGTDSCSDTQKDVVYVWEDEPHYEQSRQVFLDAFEKCYRKVSLEEMRQSSKESLMQWLDKGFAEGYADFQASDTRCWCSAKVADKIAGFVVIDLAKEPEEVYVVWLAVDPMHQGRGIGSSLIRGLLDRFSTYQRFHVVTRHVNAEAVGLYSSLGFVPTSDTHGLSSEEYRGFEYLPKGQREEMSWAEVLKNYQELLVENGVVQRQYEAFRRLDAPTIIDPRVKEIPIIECGERLIDLKWVDAGRITMLPQPKYPFEGPSFNSGLPHASKVRESVFLRLKNMVAELDKIATHFGYEPGQIDIRVFEALRDIETQKKLFSKKLEEVLEQNPAMSLEMGEQETSKWVSPVKNNVPVHSTGAAVDIGLYDNKNRCFLDLGTFGSLWGPCLSAPAFSENITVAQKKNRLYCLIAAERAGLTNYAHEWWHFSFGDRYDAYWKYQDLGEKIAQYGSVEFR